MRLRSTLAVLLAAAAVPAASPAATSLVIDGRGWGHGIGMGQWGARGFASAGWTHAQILGHYYAGTALESRPAVRMRVLLADRASVAFGSASPFALVDGAGLRLELPEGRYATGPGLRLKVGEETHELTAPVTLSPGARPLEVLGAPYRGTVLLVPAGRTLQAINEVPLRFYLHAVVPREMPAAWPAEALKAQAVAARTYALASRRPDRLFDVYADVRSQVYGGVAAEDWRTSAAVDDTDGRVVTWNGGLAQTYFFSTSGGRTASVAEEWPSSPPLPYLRSVPDPHDAASPYHRWGPETFTWAQVRKGLPGRLPAAPSGIAVTRNGSGRVARLVVDRAVTVTGVELRTAIGLRSTWFSLALLRLDATPRVAPGAAAKLTGRLVGAGGGVLERREAGGRWERVRAVRPGRFELVVKPRRTTFYRLSAKSRPGPVVRVVVAPAR